MNRQTSKIKTSWKEENAKFSYWILGILCFVILLEFFVIYINDYPLSSFFEADFIIANLNIVLIPYAVINTVYLFKLKYSDRISSPKKRLLVKCFALVIGVFLGTALIEYISHLMDAVDDDDFISLGEYTISAMSTNFIENTIIALMIGLPVFYKESLTEKIAITLKEKERELEKLYELKAKSELDAIHAKINPHFLYNALNSIVSLIHEDPDKAEQMVFSLSDLFRYSINSGGDNFSTIEEEIFLVRTYLEIEHVRFEDQLTFNIHVDEGLKDIMIPKFLIQPLIENAIKHGTSKISQGMIRLEIKRMHEDLCISVSDNGADFPKELNSGYGLKSTVDKLELLYKQDYQFQLLNEPTKQVQIILKNIFQDENIA